MENAKEFLMNAEIAFSNKRYNESLEWYQKVLAETPDDLYALSRAGAICVPLGKFDEALEYFGKAKDLDPENGDNYFNYANACFFHNDYANAFAMYVTAEQKGCSEDVTPRLYYQMAMLCSMRKDIKSALIYFQKCEDIDKQGMISLSPDLISEKLKLYMVLEDYTNAEKCAARLVAIQPTEFKNYMVYYSILMAHKAYDIAEKVLADAERYADLNDEDRFSLRLQIAALLTAKGDADSCQKAIEMLEIYCESDDLTHDQKQVAVLTLCEVYLKAEQFDSAIDRLDKLLNPNGVSAQTASVAETVAEPSSDEIETMLNEDLDRIREKINAGELADDLGMYAEVEYDEEGNERRVYDESVFAAAEPAKQAPDETLPAKELYGEGDLSAEFREKIHFTLLSAFLGKEDFASALKYARILKHSANKYYAYYGIYTSALADKKYSGNTADVERQYAEAIAFFRNKTFADPADALASVFRARLYAEQGKYVKAAEIAHLLADNDRKAVLDYIETCKTDAERAAQEQE